MDAVDWHVITELTQLTEETADANGRGCGEGGERER
jgi:hypothetical protein